MLLGGRPCPFFLFYKSEASPPHTVGSITSGVSTMSEPLLAALRSQPRSPYQHYPYGTSAKAHLSSNLCSMYYTVRQACHQPQAQVNATPPSSPGVPSSEVIIDLMSGSS